MNPIYCPMIHGGLNIDLKKDSQLAYNQCCLSTTPLQFVEQDSIDWTSSKDFKNIRSINNQGSWLPGCWECENVEKLGMKSFRQSMIEKLGVDQNLSGPKRIDLLFDRSCNLACRICGPHSSTTWIKLLKDNNIPFTSPPETYNINRIKHLLKDLDLSHLRMVQFCGGETLLGNTYWQVAEFLADIVPHAKYNLELGFQTNGTQPIDPKWYPVIDKFRLVKLMISIDGIKEKFEYLRWPAGWNKTVDNITTLRDTLPSNVMFFVQETTCSLNLLHLGEVGHWVRDNFSTNREGDPTDHNTQLAMHSYLNVENITEEYRDALIGTPMAQLIGADWQERPERIKYMIKELSRFDAIQGQDWKKTFPQVAELYHRYL